MKMLKAGNLLFWMRMADANSGHVAEEVLRHYHFIDKFTLLLSPTCFYCDPYCIFSVFERSIHH